MKRIPLAWLQLTREKRRFVAALAGISFAVAMMLTQLGFENALLSSVALVQEHLAGDLILLSPQYQFALAPGKLTERHLYQTLGIDGVESVDPVYMAQGPFKNPVQRNEHLIFMIGFNPRAPGMSILPSTLIQATWMPRGLRSRARDCAKPRIANFAGPNETDVMATLVPIDERKNGWTQDQIADEIRKRLSVIPGVNLVMAQPISVTSIPRPRAAPRRSASWKDHPTRTTARLARFITQGKSSSR